MAVYTKTRGSTRNISISRGTASRVTYSTTRPTKLAKPSPSTSQSVVRSDLESMTGHTSPGYFKTVKQNGTLPVNPFSHQTHAFDGGESEYAYYRCTKGTASNGPWTENWYVCQGYPGSQALSASYPPDIPTGPVLTKAIANLKSQLWDISTFMSEFGKTTQMVMGVGSSLRRAQNLIIQAMGARRRGSKMSPSEFMNEFNSLWLEGRYGWRPLLGEMQKAQEAYNRLGGGLATMRGASIQEDSLTTTVKSAVAGTSLLQSVRTTTATRKVRGFCGGQVNLDLPASFDPLVTAWEVIPYSFVIDWFVNIGTNIQAYSPLATGELLWSGVAITTGSESSYALEIINPPAGTNVIESTLTGGGSFTSSFKGVSRNPQAGTLSVALEVRLDVFKGVDLFAMASQVISNVTSRKNRYRR